MLVNNKYNDEDDFKQEAITNNNNSENDGDDDGDYLSNYPTTYFSKHFKTILKKANIDFQELTNRMHSAKPIKIPEIDKSEIESFDQKFTNTQIIKLNLPEFKIDSEGNQNNNNHIGSTTNNLNDPNKNNNNNVDHLEKLKTKEKKPKKENKNNNGDEIFSLLKNKYILDQESLNFMKRTTEGNMQNYIQLLKENYKLKNTNVRKRKHRTGVYYNIEKKSLKKIGRIVNELRTNKFHNLSNVKRKRKRKKKKKYI
ncbi:hypothetical protein M0813_20953 [Anaeramoeba flamelloides]|uniref:Uncharacterized protein n=1 Tax=Anaeramoeba flamelloides TaxID=1746091 RepID=A0ABQ8YJU3_9EUKA|nr:hypothetical protein M0813_20953 [Anaeramoeba flamelloides]